MKGKKEKKEGLGMTSWKWKRIMIWGCWLIAAASLCFGIYKNFTAVDTVTVKETEKITEKVENYSGLESFTENFARIYFTYSLDPVAQENRRQQLAGYMQPSLVELNSGNTYAAGEIAVQGVQVWEVDSVEGEQDQYEVMFSVAMVSGDKSETSAFSMEVHREDQAYVITKNPTVTSMPNLSEYEEKYLESSDLLSAEDREKVEAFLNTFFGVYPKATDKELAYYVRDEKVNPVGKDYTLLSIDNISIQTQEEGKYHVACYVTYMDNTIGVGQINQYELFLSPQDSGELIITEMR